MSNLAKMLARDLTDEQDFLAVQEKLLAAVVDLTESSYGDSSLFASRVSAEEKVEGDKFREAMFGADIGVTDEAKWTDDQVMEILGWLSPFRDLVHFAKFRSEGQANEWDKPELFNKEDGTMKHGVGRPVEPRWSQFVGLIAILKRLYSKEQEEPKKPCVLVADEVGVGKTIETILTITYVMAIRFAKEHKIPLPPLFGEFFTFHLESIDLAVLDRFLRASRMGANRKQTVGLGPLLVWTHISIRVGGPGLIV